jgi:hypothetical protein
MNMNTISAAPQAANATDAAHDLKMTEPITHLCPIQAQIASIQQCTQFYGPI